MIEKFFFFLIICYNFQKPIYLLIHLKEWLRAISKGSCRRVKIINNKNKFPLRPFVLPEKFYIYSYSGILRRFIYFFSAILYPSLVCLIFLFEDKKQVTLNETPQVCHPLLTLYLKKKT